MYHITGEYAERFRTLCSSASTERAHDELGSAHMTKDQRHVLSIKEYNKEQCQDPFVLETVPASLVNITTGQMASKDIEKSMRGIPAKGKDMLDQFTKERLW